MSDKKLPKDWKIKRLGDLCGIVYGKGLLTKNLKENGYPVFGANGIIGFNDKYLHEDSKVLISCRGAYSGKINFSPPKCFVTNNSLILDIKNNLELNKNYLFYSLGAANKTKLVTGTAQPQVTINNAVELKIPLPPFETQQAIISKIEELFSELDKGIEDLKIAQQQLKTYRQSVLKWAFEGKLTNHNVNEGELPKGLEWIELGKVCSFHNGDRSKKYPNRNEYVKVNEGVAFINTGHIEPNGKLSLDKMNYISKDKLNSLSGGKIKNGDLVYCLRGATIGKTAIVDQFNEGTVASSLVIIRANEDIYNRYIYYFLISPICKNYIKSFDNGTAQPNLSAKSVTKYLIPNNRFNQQMEIVQEIESRLSVADKMEESIVQSLQQAEALRQSILKKAFSGELV